MREKADHKILLNRLTVKKKIFSEALPLSVICYGKESSGLDSPL